MQTLLDVLISLIGHSFLDPVFSQFVEPISDLKRPKWYYVTVIGKNCYYWDSIRKYEYEA